MDRTTKLLLALIAAGLWANVLATPTSAQLSGLVGAAGYKQDVGSLIENIDANLAKIQRGTCSNSRLC